jgi:hypothetical protein
LLNIATGPGIRRRRGHRLGFTLEQVAGYGSMAYPETRGRVGVHTRLPGRIEELAAQTMRLEVADRGKG